ncbi:MAG: DUF4339 domain-containing protein [Waddliaceae bacterium]
MTERIWYIKIAENKEGPYSVSQLKVDDRITPQTLVWKVGFFGWLPISQVPELYYEIWGDEKSDELLLADEELVLDMQKSQPPITLIIVLLLTFFLILSLVSQWIL